MTALLREVLNELLQDGIPKTSSPNAIACCKTAQELLQWMVPESNAARAEVFVTSVVQKLDRAFQHAVSLHSQASREKMWAMYHHIRTSQEYKTIWTTFLQESGTSLLLIFYQSVTDKIFQKRLKFHTPVPCSSGQECDETTLTYEEENAIRYAAGYVLSSARKSILKSAAQQKNSLLDVINTLAKNSDEVEEDMSCEWLKTVDRGGLIHISDDLYSVFVAIELVIRSP